VTLLDVTTSFGRRVAQQLETESVIWLTTVDSHGVPQPRPVWFLWDDESFLIYSRPNTHKLAHIEHSDGVALNLRTDEQGHNVTVFTGRALIDPNEPPADEVDLYVTKYADGMKRLGMTPAQFAATYSVPIRITPFAVRGG
jgi:PPOX class probable F420-dependent enzyme